MSNCELKEIGNFIGATWTSPKASGLQSLVWRHHWNETRNAKYKNLLLTYNEDDCQALKLLSDNLADIKHSADALTDVDFANLPKQQVTESGKRIHNQLQEVLRFAHSKYDKNKICFDRNEDEAIPQKVEKSYKKGYQGQRRVKPKATRMVSIPVADMCPKCGSKPFLPTKYKSKRLVIDFVLMKTGIRKTIVEYIGNQGYCDKCGGRYAPPEIRKLGMNILYGHGIKSWVIYQRVALRLPYERIADSLQEQFNERLPPVSVGDIIRYMGTYYRETDELITETILKNSYVHVDEMPISIRGTIQYVWVFTDGKYVAFKLTKTRESNIVHKIFDNYEGILISDFYPAYDAVKCKQQKCWVHLIRNINDDLWKAPFDMEFETFVSEVRNMFVPIMVTVQKYGLKIRNLNKHKKSVDIFYKRVINGKRYKSEFASKYQKRFVRYRESLFGFLSQDGIPWQNNTAERAIRHLAKQRAISGAFGEKMMPHYLVLLGIRQTCRFQGKSFFRFLFSGETDIDKFEAHKRRHRA